MIQMSKLVLFSTFVAAGMVSAAEVSAQNASPAMVELRPLGDALEEWALNNGKQLMFDADLAAGKQTAGVATGISGMAALSKLLEGTGLVYRELNERTISIFPKSQAPKQSSRSEQSATPLRLAESADQPSASLAEAAGEDAAISKGVPEILVNGSRLLNMDIKRSRDDAQPYVIFDRETIVNSGASNLEDFFRQRLTMETSALSESQGSSFLGARSSINLRGLGANQTLILIDGHRMAGVMATGGVYQPDINGLPLSAIERIEVLPTSASGIYGGSATGGVVNIVLRRDYVGVETKLTYDNTFSSDSSRRRIDMNAGTALEGGRTTLLLAGSYSDGNRLSMKDRDFLTQNRQRILENNAAYIYGASIPPVGATTNIRSVNGSNLILDNNTPLNAPRTFVPYGYAGPSGVGGDGGQALVANAGQYNFALADTLASGLQPLSNTPTVGSLMLTARREFTSKITAFVELGGSNNVSEYPTSSLSGSFTLQANNPNNPFTTNIRVTAPLLGVNAASTVVSHDRRAVAGIIGKLPKGWMAEADFSFDRSRFDGLTFGSSGSAATDVNSGALNVMRDLNTYPADFTPYLNQQTRQLPTHAEMKDFSYRMSGPVYTLPSGAVNLSMLLERREETYEPSLKGIVGEAPTGNPEEQSQSVNSAYLEAAIPIVGSQNSVRGIRELQLQLAGRWDDYKTSGTNFVINPSAQAERAQNEFNSTNTTLGLRYVPVEDVMLRASYGTGFLPPAVNQLVRGSFVFAGFYTDPLRGNEELGVFTNYFGGNAQLEPELSTTWSAGLVFTPRFIEGLRLSVDWYRIEKRDNIIAPDPLVLLLNESRFPGRIVRDPPTAGDPYGVGPIVAIDGTNINIAKSLIEGYDLGLDYTFPGSRFGVFQLFALGTITENYHTQTFADSPIEEHVGFVTSQSLAVSSSAYPLKFKGNMGLVWKYQQWTAGWSMRYLDSYQIDASKVFGAGTGAGVILAQGNGGRVESQNYHDMFAAYRIDSLGGRMSVLANTEWQLGVRNIFNTKPPLDVSNASNGYYSGFGDPRLASYYVSLKKGF